MLEQYLGEDALPGRHPPLPGPPRSYGNTETTDLWDAIEEATGEPVRRIMDSLDLPGRLPRACARRAGRRRRRVRARRSSRFRYARRRPTATALGGPAGRRPSATATATTPATGAARRRRRSSVDASTIAGRPAVGQRQPRRHRLLPGALRARPARRACSPTPGRPDRRSSATAWSTTPGPRCWPAGRRAGVPRPGRALRRRDRPVGVAAHRPAGWPSSTAWSTATPATRCTAGSAALVGPARAGSAPTPTRARTTAPARCGACCCRRPALLGDDVAARDRAGRPARPVPGRTRRASTPAWPPPALAVCATLGDVALHERLVAAFQAAANPQDAQRLRSRSPASATPRPLQRTLDLTLSDDVRTQDAPYLLRRDAGQPRQRRARPGRSSPRTGTTIEQRFPSNSIVPAARRHPLGPRPRRSPTRSRPSSPSTRSRRATSRCASTSSAWASRSPWPSARPPASPTVPHVLLTTRDRFPRRSVLSDRSARKPGGVGRLALWVVERRPSRATTASVMPTGAHAEDSPPHNHDGSPSARDPAPAGHGPPRGART